MFEVEEIFGLGDIATATADSRDAPDCVVCLSDPRDTAILPCRHMCVCKECAEELRKSSNKCPICRGPVTAFLQIEHGEEKVEAKVEEE